MDSNLSLQTTDIENRIHVIRNQQVMIDRDLAELYGVETKRLNEQVKRNIDRFPPDFCFQLNDLEFENWRSQFATSNADKMGLRRAPYAFTEQGEGMLASVLKSETAIKARVKIMRAQHPTLTLHYSTSIHDRFLIIDNTVLYHIGASLKDLGKKCFAFEIMEDASSLIPAILANT